MCQTTVPQDFPNTMTTLASLLLTLVVLTSIPVRHGQVCNSTSLTKCGDECHCVDRTRCGGRFCERGCQDGWTNTDCQMECEVSSPTKCGEDCHCSRSFSCGFDTCLGSGCAPGWKGGTCQTPTEPCPDGKYGDRCQNTCNCPNRQSAICDKATGTCAGQCNPGYTGQDCQTKDLPGPCPDGKYGPTCQSTCDCPNRQSATCVKTTGACTGQCIPGYTGPDYQPGECPVGKYGSTCQNTCNCQNRRSAICDKTTGACTGQCNCGYAGQDCQPTTGAELPISSGGSAELLVAVIVLSILCVILLVYSIVSTLKWKRLRSRLRKEIQARYVTYKVNPTGAEQNGVYEEMGDTSELRRTGEYENVEDTLGSRAV